MKGIITTRIEELEVKIELIGIQGIVSEEDHERLLGLEGELKAWREIKTIIENEEIPVCLDVCPNGCEGVKELKCVLIGESDYSR